MRSAVRITMVFALLAPVAVLGAVPAGAAAGTTCAAQSGTATIQPGITMRATTVTITIREKLSKCSGGGVTSGTEVVNLVSKGATCNGLAKTGIKTGPSAGKITWNNKKASTISVTTVSSGLNANVTGSVKSGLFAGQKIASAIRYDQSEGTCPTTPLTGLRVTGTKPFVI
jgi:hypothetical protein